jgi:FAD/FMN-containing dehydrogenase
MVGLSAMKAISADSERGTVAVQPGVTWSELDADAQDRGLATTGAEVSSVGVAGCTLVGGIGWLHRTAGLGCGNMLSTEVVTAGQVVGATADEHEDLFWALQGGGGNPNIAPDPRGATT